MTKVILILAIIAFRFSIPVLGQDTSTVNITDFQIEKKFDQVKARIAFDVVVDSSALGQHEVHADSAIAYSKREDWPLIEIRDLDTEEPIYIFWGEDVQKVQVKKNGIRFVIEKADNELLKALTGEQKKHYVFIDKPLKLPLASLASPDSVARVLIFNPQALKQKASEDAIRLTQKEVEDLIEAKGGEFFLYSNKMDIGVETAESDTTENEYVVSFEYARKIKRINWNTFAIKDRVSTQKTNPLNLFYIYPININLYTNARNPMQVVVQSGIEGNQQFTNGRVSANLYWQGIIFNFIDLTDKHRRLRLKPVVKLGIKAFKEFDNTRNESNKWSGELYSEFYYFIPILENYSLLLEGNVFYEFGEIASNQKLRLNYDATFGVKIPKTGFKVIAKYSAGENDVNFVRDDRLILGLIMDLFEK